MPALPQMYCKFKLVPFCWVHSKITIQIYMETLSFSPNLQYLLFLHCASFVCYILSLSRALFIIPCIYNLRKFFRRLANENHQLPYN